MPQLQPEALHHLGFTGPLAKSTLADANESRDWRIWEGVANGLRLALQQQARELRIELGGLLVTLRDGKRRLEKPMREVMELQEALDTSLESSDFIALCRKMRKRNKRLARDIDRLQAKKSEADEIEKRLVALRKRIKPMPAKLSRLATLIEQGNVRHDLRVKTLKDSLRMIARNLFCQHLKTFQSHYDNLRDDHDMLRSLTRSAGVWIPESDGPTLHLHPGILTTRRNMQGAFDALLAEIPAPQTPNFPPTTLQTTLSKTAFESAIHSALLGS